MNVNWALFVDELGDRRILERLGVVPLGAGVDDRARGGFAVDGVNRQGDGLVADLVGVLGHGAEEPAVLDGDALGLAGVKADGDDVLELAVVLVEVVAVVGSGEDAAGGVFIGAVDR